jgi:N utilization substance protein B
MGARRKGREYALQILFGSDLAGAARPAKGREAQDFAAFWAQRRAAPDVQSFAESLVRGVAAHLGDIDAVITRHAKNWAMARMAAVDRNVLRVAVYELLRHPDIPERVVLNEAIDIAKKYGSVDSGAFVNGILDDIVKHEPGVMAQREAERVHASHGRR